MRFYDDNKNKYIDLPYPSRFNSNYQNHYLTQIKSKISKLYQLNQGYFITLNNKPSDKLLISNSYQLSNFNKSIRRHLKSKGRPYNYSFSVLGITKSGLIHNHIFIANSNKSNEFIKYDDVKRFWKFGSVDIQYINNKEGISRALNYMLNNNIKEILNGEHINIKALLHKYKIRLYHIGRYLKQLPENVLKPYYQPNQFKSIKKKYQILGMMIKKVESTHFIKFKRSNKTANKSKIGNKPKPSKYRQKVLKRTFIDIFFARIEKLLQINTTPIN